MPLFEFGAAGVRAVQQAIRNAWPEVTVTQTGNSGPGGIWEVSESKRVAYESLSKPCALIRWPVAEPSALSPMNMVVYEQPCIAYYLGITEGGATEPLRAKVGLLERELTGNGLVDPETGAEFTLMLGRFAQHFYDGEEMNEILIMRNQPAQAGGIAFAFLTGDDGN